jgi:hypothetical protein
LGVQLRKNAKQQVIAGIFAVFGAYLAWSAYGDRSLDRRFRALSEGATTAEVISSLGEPDAVRSGCLDAPTWLNRPVLDAQCAQEFRYEARLRPAFWTVGFDERGRAIAKYAYLAR